MKKTSPKPSPTRRGVKTLNLSVSTTGNYQDEIDNILRLIPLITKEYRKLLKLRVAQRLTQAQTAKKLKISKTTVERMEKHLKENGVSIPRAPRKQFTHIQQDIIINNKLKRI